jgi:hypothetical protein
MTTMTTKDFATYMARLAQACETVRELHTTLTYKQLAEDIGLIPRGLKWATHFRITMPKLSLLLDATVAIENQLGRDGGDFTSRIVEQHTGQPGRNFSNDRARLVIKRKDTH